MESDNPDIQWALELLKPDPWITKSFLKKYQMYAVGFATSTFMTAYANKARGLTIISRPHYFLMSWAGALTVVEFLRRYREKSGARLDAVMRDYIIRHPEDFPPPERKKYGELFTEWVPIR